MQIEKYPLPEWLANWIDYPGFLWRPYSIIISVLLIFQTMYSGGKCRFLAWKCVDDLDRYSDVYYQFHLFIIKAFRIQLHVEAVQAEFLNKKKSLLIMSNHQSNIDIPLITAAFKGPLRMVAKKSLSEIPFFGWGAKYKGHILVDRSSKNSREQTKLDIIDRIKEKKLSVWLAPEGTRSKDGSLGKFKKGSFKVAIDNNISLLVISIRGAFAANPKSHILVRTGSVVHLTFSDFIEDTQSFSVDDLQNRVRNNIQNFI